MFRQTMETKPIFRLLRVAAFALAIGAFSLPSSAAEKESLNNRLTVSVAEPSAARQQFIDTLAKIKPPGKGEQVIMTSDGRYVLCGDLFHQRKAYALVELSGEVGVGFAAWNEGKWEPRGLWSVETVWQSKSWKETEDARHFWATPPTRPFWTTERSDGVPAIVVAGEIGKRYQEFYLLSFDQSLERLDLLDAGKAEPKFYHDFVQLYDRSPRLAEFGEWNFFRWVHGKLVPVATWHEYFNNRTDEETTSITTFDVDDGKSHAWQIDYDENGAVRITQDGKLYARVTIDWPKSPKKPYESAMDGTSQEAYLFEKLSGVPRDLYPQLSPGTKLKRLEDIAKITVTGDPEAVKRFSPGTKPGQ